VAGSSRSQWSTRRAPGRRRRSKYSTAVSKLRCTRNDASLITRARRPATCSTKAPRVCFGSGRRETPDRCRVCQINQFESSATRCESSSTTPKNHALGNRPACSGSRGRSTEKLLSAHSIGQGRIRPNGDSAGRAGMDGAGGSCVN
jgi:hypothetical protein